MKTETKKKTKVVIKVNQIVIKGEQFLKVTKINALCARDLPLKYEKSEKAIYFCNIYNGLRFFNKDKKNLICINSVLSEKELNFILNDIQIASNILKKINKDLDIKNKSWNKKISYYI